MIESLLTSKKNNFFNTISHKPPASLTEISMHPDQVLNTKTGLTIIK